MSQPRTQHTVTTSPVLLGDILPKPRYKDEHVVLAVKDNAGDCTIVFPNEGAYAGAVVSLPAKATGGLDAPSGTYRLAALRKATLTDATDITFYIVEVQP